MAMTRVRQLQSEVTGRVWCSIDQLYRTFPERLAWMAEPCRMLAAQWGLRVHIVYCMAIAGAQYGPEAIVEAEELYDDSGDAYHDNQRLRSAQAGTTKLSIDELLAIARRARLALERLLRVDPNAERRAKYAATLDKMDALRATNAALARALLERKRKVN
jgi:hypothetical protein